VYDRDYEAYSILVWQEWSRIKRMNNRFTHLSVSWGCGALEYPPSKSLCTCSRFDIRCAAVIISVWVWVTESANHLSVSRFQRIPPDLTEIRGMLKRQLSLAAVAEVLVRIQLTVVAALQVSVAGEGVSSGLNRVTGLMCYLHAWRVLRLLWLRSWKW
jgi:hypothetical protein